MKICIVGAGIIGTTTAYRIVERFPQCKVVLLAENFSPQTTSDGTAGFWEPHLDPYTDKEKVMYVLICIFL